MVGRKTSGLLAVVSIAAALGGVAPAALAYNSTSTDGSWTYWSAYDTDFTAETTSYGSGGSCCVADAWMIKRLEFVAPNTTNDYAAFHILLSSGPWPCYNGDVDFLVNGAVMATFTVCHSELLWYEFSGSNWPLQLTTNSFTVTPHYGNLVVGVDTNNNFGRSYNSQSYNSVPGEFVAYFVHGYDASLHHTSMEGDNTGGSPCSTTVVRTAVGTSPDTIALRVAAPGLAPALVPELPAENWVCGGRLDGV